MRLGEVALKGDYVISLLANGKTSGVTAQTVALEVYGKQRGTTNEYQYSFKPQKESVIVNQTDWTVTLDFGGKDVDRRFDFESLEIGTYEIE